MEGRKGGMGKEGKGNGKGREWSGGEEGRERRGRREGKGWQGNGRNGNWGGSLRHGLWGGDGRPCPILATALYETYNVVLVLHSRICWFHLTDQKIRQQTVDRQKFYITEVTQKVTQI
jgi:hypothetical protein